MLMRCSNICDLFVTLNLHLFESFGILFLILQKVLPQLFCRFASAFADVIVNEYVSSNCLIIVFLLSFVSWFVNLPRLHWNEKYKVIVQVAVPELQQHQTVRFTCRFPTNNRSSQIRSDYNLQERFGRQFVFVRWSLRRNATLRLITHNGVVSAAISPAHGGSSLSALLGTAKTLTCAWIHHERCRTATARTAHSPCSRYFAHQAASQRHPRIGLDPHRMHHIV